MQAVVLSGARAPALRRGPGALGSRERHALWQSSKQAAPAGLGVVVRREWRRAGVPLPPRSSQEVEELECAIAVPAGSR